MKFETGFVQNDVDPNDEDDDSRWPFAMWNEESNAAASERVRG